MCSHDLVRKTEPRNPRMPPIEWVCAECGTRFKPILPGVLEAWRARRKLRREMDAWRNG